MAQTPLAAFEKAAAEFDKTLLNAGHAATQAYDFSTDAQRLLVAIDAAVTTAKAECLSAVTLLEHSDLLEHRRMADACRARMATMTTNRKDLVRYIKSGINPYELPVILAEEQRRAAVQGAAERKARKLEEERLAAMERSRRQREDDEVEIIVARSSRKNPSPFNAGPNTPEAKRHEDQEAEIVTPRRRQTTSNQIRVHKLPESNDTSSRDRIVGLVTVLCLLVILIITSRL